MLYQFQKHDKRDLMRNHIKVGGADNKGNRIGMTDLYFTKNDVPWIGVMGEFHFARCKRENWNDVLCKMKAGGVTVVVTDLFWSYHEEIEGQFDFSGALDIRAFLLECQEVGLEVIIRIGPWAHGECRNGGFPDWLLEKPFALRDNNPGYMEKARIFYEKIYEQVKGLFYKDGGNIIGIQFENELADNAEHLAALKKMALEIGYEVPIYTLTDWNSQYGAKSSVDEAGVDQIKGMDIYAISLCKLGSGNNWIGYDRYVGGTNQTGKLSTFQESKASGYPNDYSILSYDCQAMISEYGEIREQYRLTNLLHLLVQDFGDVLAPMTTLDSAGSVSEDDMDSLRYSMRTDGKSGFIFVNHYQRLAKRNDVLDVEIDTGIVKFPAFNVKGDVAFVFPFHIRLGEEILEYALAQPICKCGDTYFFAEVPGIPWEYKFAGRDVMKTVGKGNSIVTVGNIKLVILGWNQAKYLRKLEGKVYLGADCDLIYKDGEICAATPGENMYFLWNGSAFDKKITER